MYLQISLQNGWMLLWYKGLLEVVVALRQAFSMPTQMSVTGSRIILLLLLSMCQSVCEQDTKPQMVPNILIDGFWGINTVYYLPFCTLTC